MSRAPRLSDYVEAAAAEFLRETGRIELDLRWVAEFIEDSGLGEACPRQDLVVFCALVQKAIDRLAEREAKRTRLRAQIVGRRQRDRRGE